MIPEEQDVSKPATRQHPTRARHDQAHWRGGKRRKRGGAILPRLGPECVPEEGGATRGYRFPADPQTPGQKRDLQKLLANHVRRLTLKRFHRYTVGTLSQALGMSDRQITTLRQAANQEIGNAELELTREILQGMISGCFAGPLGTPRTDEMEDVFAMMNNIRLPDEPTGWEEHRDFLMFHSAFKIDYRQWREDRTRWPFNRDGKPRKARSANIGGPPIE